MPALVRRVLCTRGSKEIIVSRALLYQSELTIHRLIQQHELPSANTFDASAFNGDSMNYLLRQSGLRSIGTVIFIPRTLKTRSRTADAELYP